MAAHWRVDERVRNVSENLEPESSYLPRFDLCSLPCAAYLEELVTFFKENALNCDGTLSSLYPPSGDTIFMDLDDIVPAFLLCGETDFLETQVMLAGPLLQWGFPTNDGVLYSWRMDEFLGGLVAIYAAHPVLSIRECTERAVHSVIEHFSTTSGLFKGIAVPALDMCPTVSFSRGGGLLEVLLDCGEFCTEAPDAAYRALDWWMSNPFFMKHGLCPSKWFSKGHILSQVLMANPYVPPRGSFFKDSGSSYMSSWLPWQRQLALRFLVWLPYQRVQFMKDNSNLVFAFLKAFRQSGQARYAEAAKWWISNIRAKMCVDGLVYKNWDIRKGASLPMLCQSFTFIDILCDAYYFIDQDALFLDWACDVAGTWLRYQWPNGLVPCTPGANYDYLDDQTDFCVSLLKLAELTGEIRWRTAAERIFASILVHHKRSPALILSVDREGCLVNETVSTRFNFLFFKAALAMAGVGEIFEDERLHSFLEDR